MALILFLCVFYCYSDGFRYILNGFSVPGDDFRQSSFWVVAVIALIGAIGLDNMWRNISKKHLCLWSAFLLFAFLAASFSIWEEISRVYFAVTIVLLALYFLFFYTASEAKATLVARVAICLIVITAPVEYLVQNYRAIQHTTNLTNIRRGIIRQKKIARSDNRSFSKTRYICPGTQRNKNNEERY